jgi:hypothetical protein
MLTDVYFCRLKINHDTHEFILDSGIVANSNYIVLSNRVRTDCVRKFGLRVSLGCTGFWTRYKAKSLIWKQAGLGAWLGQMLRSSAFSH